MKPFIIKKICGFIPKIGDRIHLYQDFGEESKEKQVYKLHF